MFGKFVREENLSLRERNNRLRKGEKVREE